MKILIIGSGGREHALAWTLARSSRVREVIATPGNAGIPGSVDTPPEDIDADLYVIGPEAPLVDGLADRLRAAHLRVREAAGQRVRRQVTVTAQKPADVLGVYLYLPGGQQ